MKMEKIDSKIKDLNAIRAMHQRDFEDVEKEHREKKMSDKDFEKHKRKHELKMEKIKLKIRKLEEEIALLKKL
ncbi:MAG: hypothetical protein JXA91_05855 [Candidatus Thermoplasmatota archaeon]|nr:hypothetical protein [Candidatus Thermoplasmatota archaeon]